ncbi:MAG TPA: YbhB/YbcL family Raf kinase inhibitor-like protein [Opitutaceae bacterium]|nr:YbhB/YbcL family Raf kinase inhibitor-like protein [Opitutaceae bacterium]
MKIESSAFAEGDFIPARYSAYGENMSPPLHFRDVPFGTRSLALVLDDPDTSHGLFTHWIVFNLDPMTEGLKQGCRVSASREGNNDRKTIGYFGPRPPDGEHRYFFHLYALNKSLDLPNGISRARFDEAIRGYVIEEAKLMGRFATPAEVKA